jgi:hypothetical protein
VSPDGLNLVMPVPAAQNLPGMVSETSLPYQRTGPKAFKIDGIPPSDQFCAVMTDAIMH